jgi:predicted Zn-dependent peptidase
LLKDGVTQDEIVRTQKLIKTNTLLGLESVMNRMNRLAKTVLYYDRLVDIDEIISRVYAVTPEMVTEYARRVLDPRRFSLAAIGPAESLEMVRAEFEKR